MLALLLELKRGDARGLACGRVDLIQQGPLYIVDRKCCVAVNEEAHGTIVRDFVRRHHHSQAQSVGAVRSPA